MVRMLGLGAAVLGMAGVGAGVAGAAVLRAVGF